MAINPSVAIVILNYNGRHYLEHFLPSVMASTYNNYRVIVADNASTDNSIEWLQVHYPNVEIIINENNYGFAQGYNEALKFVEAEYYVLLNSDVEVTKGWLEPVVELMEANEKIAACQPKLLAYHHKHLFEYAGGAGGWIDFLGYPFSRGRIFDICEEDKGQYERPEPVFWASGAAMFVRSKVFHEMKGFDPTFFAHQEEIDLCWRMQLSGYTIMSCPASVVYHVGGGTLPKGERKAFLNFRNNLVMLYKNWTFKEKLWKIPFRLFLDAISAWKSLLSGDKSYYRGVYKAHISFIKWIFSDKRNNNFAKPVTQNLKGVHKGSIVWKHFVQGKKTFDEIVGKSE